GGNTDDIRESLHMMAEGRINPTSMVTHIGGLDAAAETTLNLPKIPGGKKLIYTHISLPLTAIADLNDSGDPMLRELGKIVEKTNGLWSYEAEEYLLANAKPI
ncbi:MAG: L-sorbose 1-phosphate reductase, partial [Lachnospiraceae bacterium]|nr:L-sorbose 1-phosphate reductase [Lachnospiraceae bacterium]